MCEEAALKTIAHNQGIAKRRRTKCGEMNCRKSERFDSTAEVGELKPYEESVEGSESSKHWLAIGKHSRRTDICNSVNEKVANSIEGA